MISPVTLVDPLPQNNCYLLCQDTGVVIIDPNKATPIQQYVETHGLIPELIILTHEHCDHMAGLNDLRKRYTVPVLASQACSEGIQDTKRNISRIMESYLYFKSDGKVLIKYPRFICAAADLTFTETYSYTWRGHTFDFTLAPGHTPGSTYIIVDKEQLFSGDYFIPGEEVITRLPGGDEEAYERIGKDILRALPTPLQTYPGHGSPFVLTNEVKRAYGL